MTYVERTCASSGATPVAAAPRGCDVERVRERRSGRPWRIGARAMAGTVVLLAVSSALAGPKPTSGADTIRGTSGRDAVDGRAGNDVLLGLGGNDTLSGGPGRDVVIGGSGNDEIRGGPGSDVLVGDAGDDNIDSWDGELDVVVCGPGSDTVVADEMDEISPSCERVTIRLAAGGVDSGSTLFLSINRVNGGDGRVQVAIDHPFKALPPCQALECSYSDLPTTATVLIAPDGDIGTIPDFGQDCAGMGAPCRLTMDRDRSALVTFNGSG